MVSNHGFKWSQDGDFHGSWTTNHQNRCPRHLGMVVLTCFSVHGLSVLSGLYCSGHAISWILCVFIVPGKVIATAFGCV